MKRQMQQMTSPDEQKEPEAPSPAQNEREPMTQKQHSRRFGMLEKEAQLQEFLAWIPAELRQATYSK